MATTIVTKNGTGAPTDSDLVAGELAVDLTNGRLYTTDLDSGGTVIEIGLNPSGNVDVTGTVTADGITNNGDVVFSKSTTGVPIIKMSGFANANNPYGIINFYNEDGSQQGPNNAVQIKALAKNVDGSGGELAFHTSTGTSSEGADAVERMRIDANGSVGIGTSSPSSFFFGANQLVVGSGSGAQGITIYSATDEQSQIFFADGVTGDEAYRGILRYIHTDDAMTFYTAGATERMRIDSTGRQLIGYTASVGTAYQANLQVKGSTASNYAGLGVISTNNEMLGVVGTWSNNENSLMIAADPDNLRPSSSIVFTTDATERMRISGGNLLVGDTSTVPFDGTSGVLIGGARTSLAFATTGHTHKMLYSVNTGTAGLHFYDSTNNRTDMIWDNSGNLLVGTTSTSIPNQSSNTGIFLFGGGSINVARSGSECAIFNRLTSDGEIVRIQKDGTTVGSIRTISGDSIGIGTGVAGLRFINSTNRIQPVDMSTGLNSDTLTSLGDTNKRFKDLYLSGGVYLGGTGAANKLDDYEEGTFTPTVIGSTTAGTATYSHQNGVYTKIGTQVTVQVYVNWSSGTGAGVLQITDLPFTLYSTSGRYPSASIGEYSNITGTAGHTLCGIGITNTNTVQFAENDFNSAPTTTSYDASGYIIFSMTYIAA